MEDSEDKALNLIAKAAELLGWRIIFPNVEEDVTYIVLASPEKVDEITEKLEK